MSRADAQAKLSVDNENTNKGSNFILRIVN